MIDCESAASINMILRPKTGMTEANTIKVIENSHTIFSLSGQTAQFRQQVSCLKLLQSSYNINKTIDWILYLSISDLNFEICA